MDPEEKSALAFFFAGLVVVGVAMLALMSFMNYGRVYNVSAPTKQITNVATTTMPTTWKTYSNQQLGFAFQYPTNLSISEKNGTVTLSHSIKFENHGTCDMKGDEATYPTLEDVNVSIEVKKMNVAKAAKQVSPYIPAENFTKNSLKVSPGFIDEYSVGQLKGFAIYEGAEGCGQMTYYFPLTATSTLVAQKRIPQQLSGVLSSNIVQEILATPGAISRQESDKILQQILVSFSLLTDQTSWKTYRNEEYGFEFRYPPSWILTKSGNSVTVPIVTLDYRKPEDCPSDELCLHALTVSYSSTINNEYILGGSWIGQRDYKNAEDYFSEGGGTLEKVGEIKVNGQSGYEVSLGGMGMNYGVIFENNKGVYFLSFESAWDKNSVTSDQRDILNTFKFTK